jgi:hypothetical protein
MSWRGPAFTSLIVGGVVWVACADFSASDATNAPADGGSGADVSAAGEGSVEADAAMVDGGTGQGCARFADASFCVDFEQPDPLSPMVWTAPRTSIDAGAIEITTERSVSPPHAASFVMRDGGPACDFLVLERSFTGDFQALRARASASVEVGGWFFVVQSHPSPFVSYVFLVSMGEQSADMIVQQNGPDGGPTTLDIASIPFDTTPLGVFQDVVVEVDARTHSARLTVGTKSKSATLPAAFTAKDLRVTLGPFCHDRAQHVLVDDVAVWVTP